MLNELTELEAYTTFPAYTAAGKRDTAYLGRFTFEMILKVLGFHRVLTILARGYMFSSDEPDIDRARRALCAWCSLPETKRAAPKAAWQYMTSFGNLAEEFPALVDMEGRGWFYRHVHGIIDFVRQNPDRTSKDAQKNADLLAKGFDVEWKKKLTQLQIPIFHPATEGAWTLRFDDVLADAQELGPLQNRDFDLPEDIQATLRTKTPPEVPLEVTETLAKYYIAHKPDDSDWVVLPVANFNAYFGSTMFDRKWLPKIPADMFIREKQSNGIGRFKITF